MKNKLPPEWKKYFVYFLNNATKIQIKNALENVNCDKTKIIYEYYLKNYVEGEKS